MKIPPGHEEDTDDEGFRLFGVHPSELGIVLVAAIITLGFIYILITPQNWGAIDRAMAPDQPKKARVQNGKPGETQMMIFGAKKK